MKKSILLCALFLIFSLKANLLDKSKEKFTLVSQTETQRDSLTFSISPNPLKTQRLFIHSSVVAKSTLKFIMFWVKKSLKPKPMKNPLFWKI
jgi:hypothetical protein